MRFVLLLIVVGVIIYLYLLSQKKKPEQRVPRKSIDSAFDFESLRLIQIIQESIEIINKTKDPQTAMRRYDDIKRNTERLFEILPQGRSINYAINDRKITTLADLYIIDEEKTKWLKEHVKGGVGPPELIAAVRGEHANQISKADMPITGVSDEVKKKTLQILAENATKGANPKDVYGKIAATLGDFEWPEFDKWLKIFRKSGEWPSLWEDVADYFYTKEEATIEELISRLSKATLLKLAEQYGLTLKKNAKKEEMLGELSKAISTDDRRKVFDFIYPDRDKALHRAKSELLTHHLSMQPSIEEIKKQYDEPNAQIEIMPASDCCPFCEKKRGLKIKVAMLTREQLPPFYPGCRCSFCGVID